MTETDNNLKPFAPFVRNWGFLENWKSTAPACITRHI